MWTRFFNWFVYGYFLSREELLMKVSYDKLSFVFLISLWAGLALINHCNELGHLAADSPINISTSYRTNRRKDTYTPNEQTELHKNNKFFRQNKVSVSLRSRSANNGTTYGPVRSDTQTVFVIILI